MRHSEHTRWLHPLHTAPLFINNPSDFWQRAQDLSRYSWLAFLAPFHRSCCSCSFSFLIIPVKTNKQKVIRPKPPGKSQTNTLVVQHHYYSLKSNLNWVLSEGFYTQLFCTMAVYTTTTVHPDRVTVQYKWDSVHISHAHSGQGTKIVHASDYAFRYKTRD